MKNLIDKPVGPWAYIEPERVAGEVGMTEWVTTSAIGKYSIRTCS